MTDRTKPNAETRDEEKREAQTQGKADRAPTAEEEQLAEQTKLDPEVSEREREMAERGVNQKGEGRID